MEVYRKLILEYVTRRFPVAAELVTVTPVMHEARYLIGLKERVRIYTDTGYYMTPWHSTKDTVLHVKDEERIERILEIILDTEVTGAVLRTHLKTCNRRLSDITSHSKKDPDTGHLTVRLSGVTNPGRIRWHHYTVHIHSDALLSHQTSFSVFVEQMRLKVMHELEPER